MQADDLRERHTRRPFEPFRLTLSTGEQLECRHPEMLIVGKRKAVLGVAADPSDPLADRTIDVDLLHIVKLEDLPSKTPADGNGTG